MEVPHGVLSSYSGVKLLRSPKRFIGNARGLVVGLASEATMRLSKVAAAHCSTGLTINCEIAWYASSLCSGAMIFTD